MREAEAWALATIYERAIERSKQNVAAEGGDNENETEGGHMGRAPEARPAGGGSA